MKLPERQREVLALLLTGDWEIGINRGLHVRAWIQKGGLGKGGESQDVNFNTFHSLYIKGLINRNKEPMFTRPEHWHITQKGREAVEQ